MLLSTGDRYDSIITFYLDTLHFYKSDLCTCVVRGSAHSSAAEERVLTNEAADEWAFPRTTQVQGETCCVRGSALNIAQIFLLRVYNEAILRP